MCKEKAMLEKQINSFHSTIYIAPLQVGLLGGLIRIIISCYLCIEMDLNKLSKSTGIVVPHRLCISKCLEQRIRWKTKNITPWLADHLNRRNMKLSLWRNHSSTVSEILKRIQLICRQVSTCYVCLVVPFL